jgi:hypothetical protein
LAAILRSLASGTWFRSRSGDVWRHYPPRVVLASAGGPPPSAMLHDNAWNRALPNMVVFDDTFVDENAHSGLVIGADSLCVLTVCPNMMRAVPSFRYHFF